MVAARGRGAGARTGPKLLTDMRAALPGVGRLTVSTGSRVIRTTVLTCYQLPIG